MENDTEFTLGPRGYPLGTSESDRAGQPARSWELRVRAGLGLPALLALALALGWRGVRVALSSEDSSQAFQVLVPAGGWCSHLLITYYTSDVLQASAEF